MKHLTITIMLLASPAVAQYTIQPRMHDFQPNDGFNDAGTWSNPYVVQDNRGREVGTMQQQIHDFQPGDGFNDAGTFTNSYVVEWE